MTHPAPSPDSTIPVVPSVERSRRIGWLLWMEGFIERMFILFCLYALSIGPMYWQWVDAAYAHGSPWVAAFYEPLRMLGEQFPLFGKSLNWYISLWVG